MCEMRLGALADPAGFLDAAPIGNVPGVVALAELERLLSQMHDLEPGTRSIIALRIGNGAYIHATTDPAQYAKVLEHVAAVIGDLLDAPEFVMAHVGRGELVAVIPTPPPMLAVILAQDIATHIAVEAKAYQRRFVPVPVIIVGRSVRIDAGSRHSPKTLIDEARETIRMPA